MAICEYLDEAYPSTLQLISGNPLQRAKIRAFAQAIACEVHPLNNLRVVNYLVRNIGANEKQKMQWYHHWIDTTFSALEQQLAQREVQFDYCLADRPTLADICLIPQLFNANRFNLDMSPYPLLSSIDKHCQAHKAFQKAHPDLQADA
jgi:maleylacetoacetate isomerase/maleylpyruvate isomerase